MPFGNSSKCVKKELDHSENINPLTGLIFQSTVSKLLTDNETGNIWIMKFNNNKEKIKKIF